MLGYGGHCLESGVLQHQPHHTQWSEVLHPAHVGPATDPHHSPGHPEQRDHEHLAGLPVQGVHHQEAGEGRHGDCPVHPEPAGGESRGGPVHLHQAVRCQLQPHRVANK